MRSKEFPVEGRNWASAPSRGHPGGEVKYRPGARTKNTRRDAAFTRRRGRLRFCRRPMNATFSGILSACFSYALTWGKPMNAASALAGTPTFGIGLPGPCIVLAPVGTN